MITSLIFGFSLLFFISFGLKLISKKIRVKATAAICLVALSLINAIRVSYGSFAVAKEIYFETFGFILAYAVVWLFHAEIKRLKNHPYLLLCLFLALFILILFLNWQEFKRGVYFLAS
ncbi:MAG: hypothetical protein ACPIA1_04525 [Flavobacteriaceae bacterium]